MKHFPWRKWFAAFLMALAPVVLFASPSRMIPMAVAGYTGTETLTNFPVLVRLSRQIKGFSYENCRPNGADVRFTLEDGTVLGHEIESWNPEGESQIWVRIPLLQNGTAFECWYDDADASALPGCQGGESVWEGVYAGVWHFSETNGVAYDSTAHDLDAVPQGRTNESVAVEGVVGMARQNAVTADSKTRLLVPSYDDLGLKGTFTFSGWFQANGGNGCMRVVSRKNGYTDQNGWEFELYSDDWKRCWICGAGEKSFYGSLPASLLDVWRHIALVYNRDRVSLYADGNFIGSNLIGEATDNGKQLGLGGNYSGNCANFLGLFDEVRLSAAVASPDWIKAEHDTAISPAFVSMGSSKCFCDDVLQVGGVPFEMGAPVPPYGSNRGYAADTEYECRAPAAYTNEETGVMGVCSGWKIYDRDEKLIDSGEGNLCSYRCKGTFAHLVWSYDLFYRLSVTAEEGGQVDPSGGWYAAGTDVSVTAIPDGGADYVRWRGDISEEQKRNLTITLQMTGPLSVTARFNPVFYVSQDGDDTDGFTWNTAFQTIEKAISVASYGETIMVAEGTYEPPKGLVLAKDVNIIGAGERERTIIDGHKHGDIILKMESPFKGIVSGLIFEKGRGYHGISIFSGMISNCVFRSNSVGFQVGGSGIITHCLSTNNVLARGIGAGGYVSGGMLRNSLIAYNIQQSPDAGCGGGGLRTHGGTVQYCTIAHNRSDVDGGVMVTYYGSTFYNNIIQHNTCYHTDEVSNGKTFRESYHAHGNCFYPTNDLSSDNFEDDPLFAPDGVSLLPGSPCIDAAITGKWDIVTAKTDFFGNPRDDRPDVGAIEYIASAAPACSLSVPDTVILPDKALLVAHADGFPEGELQYEWDFDGDGVADQSGNSATNSVLLDVGVYQPVVTVSDGVNTASASGGKMIVYPASRTIYVSAENQTPVPPYDTWEKAASNIVSAVEIAQDGMTVLVTNGTYVPEKTVQVIRGIHLRSVNGYEKTILSGDLKLRPLFIDHKDAVVEGFTIRDGNIPSQYGQNVKLVNGTLLGCHVTACAEENTQGGAICCSFNELRHKGYERILRCIIDNNTVSKTGPAGIFLQGGKEAYVLIENCLIANNTSLSAKDGQGAGIKLGDAKVTIRNCTIANNRAKLGRAGIVGKPVLIENCIVSGNTTLDDGADGNDIEAGTLRNSCVYPTTNDYSVYEGTVIADPLFKNIEKGNFRLQYVSPCVNAGFPGEWPEDAVDLDGGPRIKRHAIDIGCYELDVPTATMLLLR